MELYYKDLISEDASLEKLVDDLLLVVQGADELALAHGAQLPETGKQEIRARLQKLKDHCQEVRRQAVRSAVAADKLAHQYPYSLAGFAFAFGLLAGAAACSLLHARSRGSGSGS